MKARACKSCVRGVEGAASSLGPAPGGGLLSGRNVTATGASCVGVSSWNAVVLLPRGSVVSSASG